MGDWTGLITIDSLLSQTKKKKCLEEKNTSEMMALDNTQSLKVLSRICPL